MLVHAKCEHCRFNIFVQPKAYIYSVCNVVYECHGNYAMSH